MFLNELKIWNFRKYGTSGDAGVLPGLTVEFHKNFNLIIGENDAGKKQLGSNPTQFIGITPQVFTKR